MRVNSRAPNIQPLRMVRLVRVQGSTDRMLVYTNDPKRVRFPLVLIRRGPRIIAVSNTSLRTSGHLDKLSLSTRKRSSALDGI